MKAQVISIENGAAITGTTASKLIGAVGHVLSETGDPYGHAIIITDASGLAKSQIYYCAHTTDRKHALLGDDFTGVMKVIIPEYSRTDKTSADYLKANMLHPVPVNTCYTSERSINLQLPLTPLQGFKPRPPLVIRPLVPIIILSPAIPNQLLAPLQSALLSASRFIRLYHSQLFLLAIAGQYSDGVS